MNNIDSTPIYARVYKAIDDPWIGLLVLSILIFVLSIIGIVVLLFFWRRYQRRTQFYNESYILSNKPTGKTQIPIHIEDQQPKSFQTQQAEVFVPQNERYAPHDDVQQVRQFYERTTKAYF